MAEKIVQTAGRNRIHHYPCHHVCGLAEGMGCFQTGEGSLE